MASLFIKDSETAALAAELAALRGVTKTVAVRDALMEARQTYAPPPKQRPTFDEAITWLDRYREEHPLPPPTGLKADKAFFDEMWGEAD